MSFTKTAAQESLRTIDGLLKSLSTKRAKEESDPGGQDGGSSHPSANTDNSTHDPTEGAHSEEMKADITHDQPVGVEQAAEGMPGGQEAAQVNIGTQQSSPGEDPANETGSVADKLPDPGSIGGDTSHPANLDNSAVAEKYGRARRLQPKFASLRESGRSLLAKFAMSNTNGQPKRKAAGDEVLPPETVTGADDAKPSGGSVTGGSTDSGESSDEEKAAAAGAKMAELAMQAEQERAGIVVQSLADTIKNAEDNADIAADFLDGYHSKLAEGEEEGGEEAPPEEGSEGGGEEEGGGGGPPMEGGGGGEGGGGDMGEADLMQLLSGGEGMGAEDAMGGMGGDMGGGAPGGDMGGMGGGDMGGMGGAPGGDMGGMGGGMGGGAPGGAPGGVDPALLAEVLAQLGVTPEMLQAKAGAAKAAAARKQSLTGWRPRNQKEAEEFERVKRVVDEYVRS